MRKNLHLPVSLPIKALGIRGQTNEKITKVINVHDNYAKQLKRYGSTNSSPSPMHSNISSPRKSLKLLKNKQNDQPPLGFKFAFSNEIKLQNVADQVYLTILYIKSLENLSQDYHNNKVYRVSLKKPDFTTDEHKKCLILSDALLA